MGCNAVWQSGTTATATVAATAVVAITAIAATAASAATLTTTVTAASSPQRAVAAASDSQTAQLDWSQRSVNALIQKLNLAIASANEMPPAVPRADR